MYEPFAVSEDSDSFCAIPKAIQALIVQGKLLPAEQRMLHILAGLSDAAKTEVALRMALAWHGVADAARARRWLSRIPPTATGFEALRVARLAEQVGDHLAAHQWYEHAVAREVAMSESDLLSCGRCALEAARRMRLPRGRQGSWQRHMVLLKRADAVLSQLATTSLDESISMQAQACREHALRLLGAGGRPT